MQLRPPVHLLNACADCRCVCRRPAGAGAPAAFRRRGVISRARGVEPSQELLRSRAIHVLGVQNIQNPEYFRIFN